MKVYISADIEGIAGITDWDEAIRTKPDWIEFRDRMTDHVAAACEGALEAGATEITVKDSHGSGRNILFDRLPREVTLVRGWSWHPYFMIQEIDASYDALLMVGYHSRAGSGANPLAHTLSSSQVARISINGELVAEFHVYAYAAASLGVPTIFVSGDEALCEVVKLVNPHIRTEAVLRGAGTSTTSVHPMTARERIRAGAREAVSGDLAACALELPDHFEVEVTYKEATRAYRASFYPGARLVDDDRIAFQTDHYFEVLRALTFVIY